MMQGNAFHERCTSGFQVSAEQKKLINTVTLFTHERYENPIESIILVEART